jgi:uncharacterized BrkB/YihY/UPF0761 family membrane protein
VVRGAVRPVRGADCWPVAEQGLAGSEFYLPGRIDRASQLYGAIGATIVTLGWFFILGRGIVLAMELNAAIYERYGSISRVVFSLPFFRVLARKSARVRRFFGLR